MTGKRRPRLQKTAIPGVEKTPCLWYTWGASNQPNIDTLTRGHSLCTTSIPQTAHRVKPQDMSLTAQGGSHIDTQRTSCRCMMSALRAVCARGALISKRALPSPISTRHWAQTRTLRTQPKHWTRPAGFQPAHNGQSLSSCPRGRGSGSMMPAFAVSGSAQCVSGGGRSSWAHKCAVS